MAPCQRDNWDKSRHQGVHLKASEIARLRAAFDAERPHREIAREMNLASRTARGYYAKWRGYSLPRREKIKPKVIVEQQPKPPLANSARFYTSNFEL